MSTGFNRKSVADEWFSAIAGDEPTDLVQFLADLGKFFLAKVKEFGAAHVDELVVIGREVVDKIVEWDAPTLPNWLETYLDPQLKRAGYDALDSLAKIFRPAV